MMITIAALFSAIYSSTSLAGLLLVRYAAVAQFFPGMVLGLYSMRATMPSVFAGLVTGVLIAVVLLLTKHDPVMGLNAGFIALCFNFAVTGVVSLLTSTDQSEIAPDFAASPALQSQDKREPT